MNAKFPILPIAAGAVVSALAAGTAGLARGFKALVQVRKNRRQAHALANLDRRMLADIGITRSDVSDAFSEPFWEDPTALLRERALERRLSRATSRTAKAAPAYEPYRRTSHLAV